MWDECAILCAGLRAGHRIMIRKAQKEEPHVGSIDETTQSMLEEYSALGVGPSDIPDALDDPDWVRSTGKTPIEFLTAAYRHPLVPLKDRISAAKTVAEYTSRKMPSAIELAGKDGGPLRVSNAMLSGLSDEELSTLEALLDKAARSPT